MRLLFRFVSIAVFLFFTPITASATTYYLSPSGNDSNNGSSTTPWKSIAKANATLQSGDTVILKNGVYPAYVSITKSGTTWKSENKHQAILDGGFSPSLLQGKWSNIVTAWDSKCTNRYTNLLTIATTSVTVDGLFLRNSCGRGLLFTDSAQKITLKNSMIDWTFSAGSMSSMNSKEIQLIDNIFTRVSFDDQYNLYSGAGYGVNVTMFIMGENNLVKGNIVAWGRGEIAANASKNLVIENNSFIGNKTNIYTGWSTGLVFRNNLIWSPESENNPNTHWEKKDGGSNNWHTASRNENDPRFRTAFAPGLVNSAFYNNVYINNRNGFDGYHRGGGQFTFSSDTLQLYFGHNTIITGTNMNSGRMFSLTFAPEGGFDSKITGIVENNIFDNSKNRNVSVGASLSPNDQVTFRNNLLPTNTAASFKGSNNIITNDPGLTNSLAKLNIAIPGIGVNSVDINALKTTANLYNYRLKSTSPAINKGSSLGTSSTTLVPALVRAQDYFGLNRVGLPDIGAIEFNGTPSPITTTPNPTTPSSTLTPNPTSISPTPISWDLNSDGKINIFDWSYLMNGFGNRYDFPDITKFKAVFLSN